MDATRGPNMVPRGSIRLSEAFDLLCARLDPKWSELPELCVRFDEWIDQGETGNFGEDPYRRLFEIEYRAERLFRWALSDGKLRAFIHNLRTGVDLELPKSDWNRMGDNVGIHSDYTDHRTPGPNCQLDGVSQPIFFWKEAFESWLGTGKDAAGATQGNAARSADLLRDIRAFSLEEVIERTGLSRTKLYEEIKLKHLVARKCGDRTLVLESDLNQFFQSLPSL